MNIAVLLSFIILSSIFINSVSAFPGFDSWNIFSDLKRASQSFVEAITIDPIQKQEIILRNMAGWQTEKEQLIKDNQPVPPQYDEIISAKQSSIDRINTESSSALNSVIDTVLMTQEMEKIKEYVKRFHDIKENSNVLKDQIMPLEKDVNQLNLVKKHCRPVSVNVLLSVVEPYDSLVNDYCPILKSIPKSIVMASLGENDGI